MKILCHSSFVLLVFSCMTYGQESFVHIDRNPNLDILVRLYKDAYINDDYFTIQIHSSIGRLREAKKKMDKAKMYFPDYIVKLDFEDQKYKVYVGKFKTTLEADRKKQKIRTVFENVFIRPFPK